MGICVENLEGLKRRIRFSIPAERIYAAVQKRLKELAVRSQIPGFRQGKAPMAAVEQMLGSQLRQDVIEELLLDSFKDVAVAENLQPSGPPSFEWVGTKCAEVPQFAAVFEVEPDFVPASVEQIRVERPVTEIDEASIEQRLEELRRLHCNWLSVGRPGVCGDRVVVDLRGEMEGELFYWIRRIPIVLGSGRVFPALGRVVQEAFCRDLVGLRPGEQSVIEVGFPADHNQEELAGQRLCFNVRVHEVAEQVLPELNSAFARRVGMPDGDPERLRPWLRQCMEQERQHAIAALVRQQILDALVQLNPIDVPTSYIDTLFERRLAQSMRRMSAEGFHAEDVEIASWLIEQEARKQAAIDLILARIAREQGFLSSQEADAGLRADPAEREEAVTRPGLDRRGEAPMSAEVENTVIDWVYRQAQVVETPLPFSELMARWKCKTA